MLERLIIRAPDTPSKEVVADFAQHIGAQIISVTRIWNGAPNEEMTDTADGVEMVFDGGHSSFLPEHLQIVNGTQVIFGSELTDQY